MPAKTSTMPPSFRGLRLSPKTAKPTATMAICLRKLTTWYVVALVLRITWVQRVNAPWVREPAAMATQVPQPRRPPSMPHNGAAVSGVPGGLWGRVSVSGLPSQVEAVGGNTPLHWSRRWSPHMYTRRERGAMCQQSRAVSDLAVVPVHRHVCGHVYNMVRD